jgi:hypothetical protein
MKTIIAGSKRITDYSIIQHVVLEPHFTIIQIISGRTCGVDSLRERCAHATKNPYVKFILDWNWFGKRAGILGN